MNYRALLTGGSLGVAILLAARARARRRRVRDVQRFDAAGPRYASDDPGGVERWLDEAIEETFPASDPPSFMVHTGVYIRPEPYLDR